MNMLIGKSKAIKEIEEFIKKASSVDYPIVILGETGVGKTLVAKLIHLQSKRKDNKFIQLNCSNIPEALFESEFFGHEKGSFTGATERRIGKVELAAGGTLLLDEVCDLSAQNKAKILQFIESKKFYKLGGIKEIYKEKL